MASLGCDGLDVAFSPVAAPVEVDLAQCQQCDDALSGVADSGEDEIPPQNMRGGLKRLSHLVFLWGLATPEVSSSKL